MQLTLGKLYFLLIFHNNWIEIKREQTSKEKGCQSLTNFWPHALGYTNILKSSIIPNNLY